MIAEQDLRPVKASELFPGAWFYLKTEDGTFALCKIDYTWHPPGTKSLDWFRKTTLEHSKANRLFVRRDKPFHNFSECIT